MRRIVSGLVLAGVLAAGVSFGGTLAVIRDNYSAQVAGRLASIGVATGAVAKASAAWDEDVFVDTVLKQFSQDAACDLITFVMQVEKLSVTSREKIRTALLARTMPPQSLINIVRRYPVGERAAFAGALDVWVQTFSAKQLEWMRMRIKYDVLQGISDVGEAVEETDLVRTLLASEPLTLENMQVMKNGVLQRATRLARMALRAEGKSFVIKNGVNPLEAMVKPVVDALNARGMAGLEAALRGLGSSVADVDRSGLETLAAGWRIKIMNGEITGADAVPLLGKIALMLGADGYNRFVDEYNNGTAGGK